VNVTAWASGLEVAGDGTGIVSHAGLGLVRRLSDKTGLTRGLSEALFSGRVLGHDRGRVLADISCAIADGARAISDFRVLADQAEAFGQVASVPTAYRTLEEITRGGTRTQKKLTAAINAARRYAWTQEAQRHGTLPGVRVADKTLQGVTCIRIDATVTPPIQRRNWLRGISKGFGHYPLLAFCDNTGGEPLAWMLRKGSAGSNTAADHIAIVDAPVAALPSAWRRNLMVTSVIRGAKGRNWTLLRSCRRGRVRDERTKAATTRGSSGISAAVGCLLADGPQVTRPRQEVERAKRTVTCRGRRPSHDPGLPLTVPGSVTSWWSTWIPWAAAGGTRWCTRAGGNWMPGRRPRSGWSRSRRGRSRSITAARSASAVPRTRARTPAAGTAHAGSRKRT
jgi:hypothetical protein